MGMYIVVLVPSTDLVILFPDIQLSRPKPVHGRIIHGCYMLLEQ